MHSHVVIHPDYHDLADFITRLPGHFDSDGELLYDHRNQIKRYEIGDHLVVAKRYRRPRAIQKIVYSFFRKSKAERAYYNGLELCRRGFSTPFSIAYIEEKRRCLLEDSYYICENDDTPPIADLIVGASAIDPQLPKDLGVFFSQLHRRGILHHDLNDTNILCHEVIGGHYDFSLIDNNRMRFYPDGTLPPKEARMENITRFTGDMDLFRKVAEAYCDAMGYSEEMLEEMIAAKKRHDYRWDRKKELLARLKGRH